MNELIYKGHSAVEAIFHERRVCAPVLKRQVGKDGVEIRHRNRDVIVGAQVINST